MCAKSSGHAPEVDLKAELAAIVEELAQRRNVVASSMFGMPCGKRPRGKAFMGAADDGMVFKLDGDAHAEALALTGAHVFDPMGNRPMKQWVVLPAAHRERWLEFAEKAEAALPA